MEIHALTWNRPQPHVDIGSLLWRSTACEITGTSSQDTYNNGVNGVLYTIHYWPVYNMGWDIRSNQEQKRKSKRAWRTGGSLEAENPTRAVPGNGSLYLITLLLMLISLLNNFGLLQTLRLSPLGHLILQRPLRRQRHHRCRYGAGKECATTEGSGLPEGLDDI
jgi:hypothetical protein